jgi:hypothetical protein
MPNKQRGLDTLRDFTFEDLAERHAATQASYDQTHEAMTLMKNLGAQVDGLHRSLNRIARERRCFWLTMKRRIVREGGAAINPRLIRELKPNTKQFIGLQTELGFPGRWPNKLIDPFGRIWVYERTTEDEDVSFYVCQQNGSLPLILRVMTERGVKALTDWMDSRGLDYKPSDLQEKL